MNAAAGRPVFLDRDGTLIVEKHFLSDPAGVSLEEGVAEGLGILRERGHPLFVLTNQSGIGRGLFAAADAQRVNDRVSDLLRASGIDITAWYMCPHAPEALCECRKPLPGMAVAAARDWNLTLQGSYVIGDRRADIELADAIGAMGLLVATGYGVQSMDWARAQGRPVFNDLRSAAAFIAADPGAPAAP